MTNLIGGSPLSASAGGGTFRMVGEAISSVASKLVTISSATVLSDNVAPNATVVGLDTAPSVPVSARSVTGRLAAGTRVVIMLYPPRGVLVLGTIDESDGGLMAPMIYSTPGITSFDADDVQGAIALRVRVQGGGGGGAGSPATGAAQTSVGGSGSGGGYAESILEVSSLVFPVTVVVAPGGTAGAAGGASGVGGSSAFGAYVVATGGAGGSPAGPVGGVTILTGPGAPGFGTAGQILIAGQTAGPAFSITNAISIVGTGGSAQLGPGGISAGYPFIGTSPYSGYGGGAAGANNGPSQAARVGAVGGPGIVIVERLYRR
jgi:hypothetical protein